MKVWLLIKKFLFWLWPPLEAYISNREILKEVQNRKKDDFWETLFSKMEASLPKNGSFEEIEYFVGHIYESEGKRKDILEQKALVYFLGNGISIGVVSSGSFWLSEKFQLTGNLKYLVGFLLLLAGVHFLVAAYYALKARKVEGFACLTPDTLKFFKESKSIKENTILIALVQSKWNEDLLLLKSNNISVAEELFSRGLAFVAFIFVFVLGFKFFIN